MAGAMTQDEVQAAWLELVHNVRTGVLLTLRNRRHSVPTSRTSWDNWTPMHVHLSRLALHT